MKTIHLVELSKNKRAYKNKCIFRLKIKEKSS